MTIEPVAIPARNVFQRLSDARDYPESLLAAFSYNKDTGVFTHNKKLGVKEGTKTGCDNGYGYLRVIHKKKSYYANRLAWFFMYGEIPPEQIDHINGNRSDNRISNLRLASKSQNAWNKQKAIGVSWHKKANKWQAFFKHKYLGLFDRFEDARSAYESAKMSSNPFTEEVA